MKSLSIRNKIWLTIISVSVLTIILVVVVSYYLYQTLYIEKQTETLLKQGQFLEQSYYENNPGDFSERLDWLEGSTETSVIFTDDQMQLASGAPFDSFADENLITFSERQDLLKGKTLTFTKFHTGLNQEISAVVIPLSMEDRLEAVIFLYIPLTAITEAFEPIRNFLIVGVFLVIILLILVGTKMTNRIVQPIKQMEKVAKDIAQGDFSKRLSLTGEDEMASLGRSINTMTSNLDEVDRNRREFLGNVSHELRTPISYLKGYSEALDEGIISIEKFAKTVKKETDRMDRLVHDLLDLAQLEGDSYPMNKEPVILAELVKEVLDRFRLKLDDKNLIAEVQLDEGVVVNGDYGRLDQVIDNLLSNAIKFSANNRTIRISVVEVKTMGILKLEDEGIGIPEEDVPYIFERFYRVEKARTRKSGGTGLGLSIVQQIINKHEGRIHIDSKREKGTVVTVEIPLFHFY
ncbi:two-component sensor histidine kinase [Sutcliffiella horikoshii]|uniref:histidine kinase n=1 Tax=Sutcliffiella horikoshii TaxID=79883 RepID=A0ABM6KGR5_9BACI|nr:ATP-binding protein [Sutcliffiella horikoshii]ART75398.1 two-component sensor histidine kinase [Sutcliffiella horikoshii]